MATTEEKRNREFEVEEAARTLQKAEEIRADTDLHNSALKHLKKQQKAVGRVLGVEKRSDGKFKIKTGG